MVADCLLLVPRQPQMRLRMRALAAEVQALAASGLAGQRRAALVTVALAVAPEKLILLIHTAEGLGELGAEVAVEAVARPATQT